MKFDDLLKRHVGEFGRWQAFMLAILFYEEVYMGFQVMLPVYIAATPQHWCQHPDRDAVLPANCSRQRALSITVPYRVDKEGTSHSSKCDVYSFNLTELPLPLREQTCEEESTANGTLTIPPELINATKTCEAWEYDQDMFSSTIVTEWNLVCGNRWMASTVAAAFLGGRAVGNFVFGWLGDRFGRKPIFLVCGLCHILCAVTCAVSPSYVVFVVVRFFCAVFATGKTSMGYIMSMEIIGPSYRVAVGTWYMVAYTVGYMLLTPIAYFVDDWRTLMLVVTVPEVTVYLLMFFLVPESPRWLYVNNKHTRADRIVEKMAKTNRKSLPTGFNVTEHVERFTTSPVDLVRTPQIRMLSLVLFYQWAATILVYYGLSLNTGNIGGNPYVNTFIGAAIEIPAYLSLIPMFRYFGRVKTFLVFNVAAGIFLLACMPVPQRLNWLAIALSMVGKFFNAAVTTGLWTYSIEVYPTSIRSIGLTVTSITARISSAIAPYVLLLNDISPLVPTTIFAVASVTTGLLSFLLPETRDQPLGQTIEDGEEMIRKNKIFCTSSSAKKNTAAADATPLSVGVPEQKPFI